MDLEKITEHKERQQEEAEKKKALMLDVTLAKGIKNQVKQSGDEVQKALVAAVEVLVKALRELEPSVTVKNQTPSKITVKGVDAIAQAVDNLTSAAASTTTDTAVLSKAVQELSVAVKSLPKPTDKVTVTNQPDYSKDFKALQQAVSGIDVRPQVNVQGTKVSVPELNLAPITDAVKGTMRQDLSEYKAQDLTGDDNFQYVGFLSPGGGWYILENDIQGGTLRYKFGEKNYKSNWRSYMSHPYKLLSEAIREIQT